jgi:hypothetical protein
MKLNHLLHLPKAPAGGAESRESSFLAASSTAWLRCVWTNYCCYNAEAPKKDTIIFTNMPEDALAERRCSSRRTQHGLIPSSCKVGGGADHVTIKGTKGAQERAAWPREFALAVLEGCAAAARGGAAGSAGGRAPRPGGGENGTEASVGKLAEMTARLAVAPPEELPEPFDWHGIGSQPLLVTAEAAGTAGAALGGEEVPDAGDEGAGECVAARAAGQLWKEPCGCGDCAELLPGIAAPLGQIVAKPPAAPRAGRSRKPKARQAATAAALSRVPLPPVGAARPAAAAAGAAARPRRVLVCRLPVRRPMFAPAATAAHRATRWLR